MEIQTNTPQVGTPPSVPGVANSGPERSAPPAQTPQSQPSAGIVVDIQSRQDPLSVAYSRTLQSLSENFGLSSNGSGADRPTSPEGVATRISSVAANVIANANTYSDNPSDLAGLADSIRQTVDRAFDEARSTATDPQNIPLQQARDATKFQLDTLESLIGLRDSQA